MTRLALLLALAFGFTASPALASKAAADASGEMTVVDEAGLFSADAIAKAKAAFAGTTFHGKVKFAVHTVKAPTGAKKAEYDAIKSDKDADNFFEAWARHLLAQDGGHSILMLIHYDRDHCYTRVVTDRDTARDKGRHFSDDKARAVTQAVNAVLKPARKEHITGEALHEKLDPALIASTDMVIEDLRNTAAPAANSSVKSEKGSGIMGYICIGLCVLLGVWLVVGLIRAFTGGGGGGGMGGGGYGGGGGGFMSGMLGGMFGGLAGMWMYNHMFGGGMSNLGATDSMSPDGGGGDIDGGNNYDTGASAGGGDFGDNGDAGGGGDWGGGDAGGGDFGGGGGDFGGGGDW